MDAAGAPAVILLWLKAAHVAAIVAWLGGMILNAVVSASLRSAEWPLAPQTRMLLQGVRRWDRRVTTPAMLLTWAFGLALATMGGWFPARWLLVKLALVLGLSGLHGLQAGRLRRMATGLERPALSQEWVGAALLAAVAAIAVLVIVKPI